MGGEKRGWEERMGGWRRGWEERMGGENGRREERMGGRRRWEKMTGGQLTQAVMLLTVLCDAISLSGGPRTTSY